MVKTDTDVLKDETPSTNPDPVGTARNVNSFLATLYVIIGYQKDLSKQLAMAEDAFYSWRGRCGTDSAEVDFETFLVALATAGWARDQPDPVIEAVREHIFSDG